MNLERVSYKGWKNCLRLGNEKVELVVTTDVGPRVISFGFAGGQNLFKNYKEQLGRTGGDQWHLYGGHRLWHAPEDAARTYWPDNGPVSHAWDGTTLKLTQPVEVTTGLVKELEITIHKTEPAVRVLHRLINRNLWDVELAPWAATVLEPGGRLIFPQEPYRPHPEYLLPARPLVLWHYTDMSDPRWIWGRKYIQLRQDTNANTKQKLGLINTLEWGACCLGEEVFIKRYAYQPGAGYADMGTNTQIFTDSDMIEFETMGPLTKVPAAGGSVEHTEVWYLAEARVGEDESEIESKVLPLVKATEKLWSDWR